MSAQTLEKKETSGCISEAFAIDLLLEADMERLRGGGDPPEIQMMLWICISTSVSVGWVLFFE